MCAVKNFKRCRFSLHVDADADAVAAEAEAVDECPASETADTVDCLQDARSWEQLQKVQGQEHERQLQQQQRQEQERHCEQPMLMQMLMLLQQKLKL